jgi:ParB/RepB/Spo0J family partition protein
VVLVNESRLPDTYDRLVPCSLLRHGEHNVRAVAPRPELKRSIEKDGMQDSLIVRPDTDGDQYHVTDGWQRYQAAVELGWEQVPVTVYKDTLAALEAAEANSIVREWTTYQWAKHVESLQTELAPDCSTERAAKTIAKRTPKSKPTVKRYLYALELPAELRPLLKERQNINDDEWQAAENYRSDVRRFEGLSWQVAAEAGKRADAFGRERLIRVTLATLGYNADAGVRLVKEAAGDPAASVEMLRYRVLDGADTQDNWIRIPQTGVRIENDKKEAIMDYCQQRRVHLSDIVERRIRSFADEVSTEDRQLNDF